MWEFVDKMRPHRQPATLPQLSAEYSAHNSRANVSLSSMRTDWAKQEVVFIVTSWLRNESYGTASISSGLIGAMTNEPGGRRHAVMWPKSLHRTGLTGRYGDKMHHSANDTCYIHREKAEQEAANSVELVSAACAGITQPTSTV